MGIIKKREEGRGRKGKKKKKKEEFSKQIYTKKREDGRLFTWSIFILKFTQIVMMP